MVPVSQANMRIICYIALFVFFELVSIREGGIPQLAYIVQYCTNHRDSEGRKKAEKFHLHCQIDMHFCS